MIISNCVQNEDGSLDFDFHVNADEANFFMDYAVRDLIRRGVFTVAADQAEQELEILKEEGGLVQ